MGQVWDDQDPGDFDGGMGTLALELLEHRMLVTTLSRIIL